MFVCWSRVSFVPVSFVIDGSCSSSARPVETAGFSRAYLVKYLHWTNQNQPVTSLEAHLFRAPAGMKFEFSNQKSRHQQQKIHVGILFYYSPRDCLWRDVTKTHHKKQRQQIEFRKIYKKIIFFQEREGNQEKDFKRPFIAENNLGLCSHFCE